MRTLHTEQRDQYSSWQEKKPFVCIFTVYVDAYSSWKGKKAVWLYLRCKGMCTHLGGLVFSHHMSTRSPVTLLPQPRQFTPTRNVLDTRPNRWIVLLATARLPGVSATASPPAMVTAVHPQPRTSDPTTVDAEPDNSTYWQHEDAQQ